MPDFYLSVDVFVVIALFGLGLTVLLKNSTSELNRIFAQFTSFIGIWIIANYVGNDLRNSPKTAKIATYLVFLFSYAAAVFLLRFSIVLAGDEKAAKILSKFKFPLVLVGLISCSPLVTKGVFVQNSVYAVIFGPLMPLYLIGVLCMVGATIYVLVRNINKTTGEKRARLNVLLKCLYITMPALLIMDLLIPAITGWFGLTNIAILSMLILVYGLYYGVVKHHMFDLRLIIVRSVGYVVTLGAVAGVYGAASYYLTKLISSNNNPELAGAINTLLIIAVVLSYGPAKKAFERLTNRFFFRDAYDAQVFLDEFNKVLVSNFELDSLLKKASLVIESNLKSTYTAFNINETGKASARIIGTNGHPTLSNDDIEVLRKGSARIRHKLIVVENLDDKELALQKLFRSNEVAVIARLSPSTSYDDIGYLLLGPKKSGNVYNSQDLRIIEIIINGFVIAIQNALHIEEVESFNATLQKKIADATRQLRRNNEKLKTLDETKDDFISMASHQLRTPLTSVKGYVSMVLEGDAGKLTSMQREMLGQAYLSSQRMVYLIADLLNVSRLKTGKFIIDPTTVNLAEVVDQEISQLKETAASRSLTLSYDKPEDFPDLMLDDTKIRQVIMNFMDNAIYYTPAGGQVIVRLIDNPATVELRVVDDGIGVPRSEQPHLFTKFYRAGNARKARPDGTGLGLFMAKKVVIAQGGALVFDSKEGKGSTFGFIFSKAKLKIPEPTVPTAQG